MFILATDTPLSNSKSFVKGFSKRENTYVGVGRTAITSSVVSVVESILPSEVAAVGQGLDLAV